VIFTLRHNGIGKSSLLDRLLHITCISEAGYAQSPPISAAGVPYRLRGIIRLNAQQKRSQPQGQAGPNPPEPEAIQTRSRSAAAAAAASTQQNADLIDVDGKRSEEHAATSAAAGRPLVVRMTDQERQRFTGPDVINHETKAYQDVLRNYARADPPAINPHTFSSFLLPCSRYVVV